LDASSVRENLKYISTNFPGACVIIKSTVPIGFTAKMQKKFPNIEIFFSPEFLREGYALYDVLYPSRIILGSKSSNAKKFAKLLTQATEKKDVEVLFMDSTEAESVKLFSNTYLAMRVAFFNELDTYAAIKGLDTKSIIQGVSLDPRIGNFYNNPSFAYGGYCLPKDSKQLAANYKIVPEALISSIVESNKIRLHYCIENILSKRAKTVGIFRLTAKEGAAGFRFSAISYIMKKLEQKKINIIIYEPILHEKTFQGHTVENNLSIFKKSCDLIIANRTSKHLNDVKEKVYTRDVFARD
ncbi:MAG: nucleotide sugar dehydrogenase, partial [Treponema sp.]|nr:nucleotide sugar dehydrogenase [Treponema sp.]